MNKRLSPYLQAIEKDNSINIEQVAVDLWLKDLQNPTRWWLRPILQAFFAALLHLVWFLKRLPLPQFRAHKLLQWMICWFCKYFVSHEANLLILRHFATESNILNFLAAHSTANIVEVALFPKSIEDMKWASFVEHDQELFRVFTELGYHQSMNKLDFSIIQEIDMDSFQVKKRATQVLDFETSHALFMCLFCLLLTKEEYRDAINGFNLDQSMAIRTAKILDKPTGELEYLAFNKYPHYLVGPWNLSHRFLMHGFFTEYLYAELITQKNSFHLDEEHPQTANHLVEHSDSP